MAKERCTFVAVVESGDDEGGTLGLRCALRPDHLDDPHAMVYDGIYLLVWSICDDGNAAVTGGLFADMFRGA